MVFARPGIHTIAAARPLGPDIHAGDPKKSRNYKLFLDASLKIVLNAR